MVGNLQNQNAANSKTVQPRAKIGIAVRVKTGTITDWKCQVSPDGTNWIDTDLSFTGSSYKTLEPPQGWHVRLAGTAADLEITVGYLAQARVSQIDIERDIT